MVAFRFLTFLGRTDWLRGLDGMRSYGHLIPRVANETCRDHPRIPHGTRGRGQRPCRLPGVAIAAVEAVLLVAIARPSASCDLRSDPTGLGGTEMTHTTVMSVIMTV